MQECLQQKELIQYSISVERIEIEYDFENYTNSSNNIQLVFMAASKTRNVFEEVLIFDEISLVILGYRQQLFTPLNFDKTSEGTFQNQN